jgi:uncharacterized protein DUF6468
MSLIGLAMNLLLAALLVAALGMGWRLNRRLKALRDSHDGFAIAVAELNTAAARAEQGLSDLRAATDEAVDILGDRIEKGRLLATRLDRLIDHAPVPQRAPPAPHVPQADPVAERRLGALLAAAREARPDRYAKTERFAQTERLVRAERQAPPPRRFVEEDLFDDEPLTLDVVRGAAR